MGRFLANVPVKMSSYGVLTMGILSNVLTIIAISAGIAILIFMAYYFIHNRHSSDDMFEDMEGEEFEKYCAELLTNKGFENVEMTPGSHDFGADILADYEGVTYAIQCKCYSDMVGVKAVQEAYAGRDFYDCMVAVVMTNQFFTKSAIQCAEKLHVILWNGEYLDNMIRKYGSGSKELSKVSHLESQKTKSEIKAEKEMKAAEKAAEKVAKLRHKQKPISGDGIEFDSLDDIEDKSEIIEEQVVTNTSIKENEDDSEQ